VWVCSDASMYLYPSTYLYILVCVRVCICEYLHRYMHAHVFIIHMCIHMNLYAYTCIHAIYTSIQELAKQRGKEEEQQMNKLEVCHVRT